MSTRFYIVHGLRCVMLSRLKLPDHPNDGHIPSLGDFNLVIQQLSDTVVAASHICQWTAKDQVLSQVHHFFLHGWPDSCSEDSLKPYFVCQNELSAVDGCILWGARVVIYRIDSMNLAWLVLGPDRSCRGAETSEAREARLAASRARRDAETPEERED
uniref:Uncharacterized protein n=1 Tax=Amphimedon queenslandica TaxID=400682 RepID=A0A1X7TE39_AMPQE